jgi:flagellar basal-body rod modification protein FlgD
MIDPINAWPLSPAPAGASGPPGVLGKDDFLQLLIAQLRHQDPLSPFDQNQFLAQTAQFTSLEQLQTINQQLTELKILSAGSELTRAVALLGKTATVVGREVQVTGGATRLDFTVRTPGTEVIVDVYDRNGVLVRTITTDALGEGPQSVEWDGLDSAGRAAPAGAYSYRVSSRVPDPAGAPRVVVAEGVLTGFERRGDAVYYRMGTALVRLEDIVRLS